MGAHLQRILRESLITKEPVEENSGDGVSLHRGPLGNWGGVHFLGILRDIWRALEREHLSL